MLGLKSATSVAKALDERGQVVPIPFSGYRQENVSRNLSSDTSDGSSYSTPVFPSAFSPVDYPSPASPSEERALCEFYVVMNVKHFKPDELLISLDDGYVVVQGKHNETADPHGYIAREFKRRYHIPNSVDPSAIVARRDLNHILVVRSPVKEVPRVCPVATPLKPVVIIKPTLFPDIDEQEKFFMKKEKSRKKVESFGTSEKQIQSEQVEEVHSDQKQDEKSRGSTKQFEEKQKSAETTKSVESLKEQHAEVKERLKGRTLSGKLKGKSPEKKPSGQVARQIGSSSGSGSSTSSRSSAAVKPTTLKTPPRTSVSPRKLQKDLSKLKTPK